MSMRMAAMGMIGATRGLERLADLGNSRAEPFEHGADHMIAQDQDTFLLDLRHYRRHQPDHPGQHRRAERFRQRRRGHH